MIHYRIMQHKERLGEPNLSKRLSLYLLVVHKPKRGNHHHFCSHEPKMVTKPTTCSIRIQRHNTLFVCVCNVWSFTYKHVLHSHIMSYVAEATCAIYGATAIAILHLSYVEHSLNKSTAIYGECV